MSVYKCKRCGNTNLEMVREVGTQHPATIKEKKVVIDFGSVPKEHYKQYYQCDVCKEKLLDADGEIISDHPSLKKWMAKELR